MANTNTRVGTATNLPTGATYDLLMMSFPAGFPQSSIDMLIGDTPRKVTGVQKVIQVYLKTLYTTAGSDPFYPNRGTQFAALTYSANRISSDSVLQSELTSAIASASSQTQGILNTTTTDLASQLASVDLLGIDTGETSIALYLKFTTSAGVSASISIPFPQLDMVTNG